MWGMKRLYPLHSAALAGDVEQLSQLLVSRPEDVNAVDGEGKTPLRNAIESGDKDCVEVLLKSSAHVTGQSGSTPLHIAVNAFSHCCRGQIKLHDCGSDDDFGTGDDLVNCDEIAYEIIALLLKNGADVDARDASGNTTFHRACRHVAGLLAPHSVNVDAVNSVGRTPLHVTVSSESPRDDAQDAENVNFWLSNGASVNMTDSNGWTPLHHAARNGKEECVNSLLSKGADVNGSGSDGMTPLHCAAMRGSEKCVSLLLSKCADVNVSCGRGLTPLHYAAHSGSGKCVSMLLSNGADVNALTKGGSFTPLHVAAKRGSKTCVSLLLSNGADVNVITRGRSTPLHLATEAGFEKCVSLLLSKDANVDVSDIKGLTPMNYAVENGKLGIIMLLAPYSTDVNVVNGQGESLLLTAVKQKNVELVELLLAKGACVEARDDRCSTVPLHYAVEHKLIDIVRLLIPHCKNVSNEKGETALHIALRNWYGEGVRLLLDCGANVDVEDHCGQTPLHCALKNRDREFAALIISRSSNVNAIDNIGDSPLHIAVKQNDAESVNLLLRNGADVNINQLSAPSSPPNGSKGKNEIGPSIGNTSSVFSETYPSGGTPLHIAVKSHLSNMAQWLLSNGASVNAEDRRGWTPLHIAVKMGNLEIVKLLLSNGASVNAKDRLDCTPLHFFVPDFQIGKLLILHGADVNAASETGETVLHVAAKCRIYTSEGWTDFVKLLLSRGGNIHACDQTGACPLHYATHWQSLETLSLLIDSANVNAKNNLGETPLHVAIRESDGSGSYRGKNDDLKNIVKLFSNKGAEINARNEHGHTLLHYAVAAGYEEVAKAIVERGGNVNASTANGLTPLHIAACTDSDFLAKFLLQSGANVDAISSDGNLRTLSELLKRKSRVHAIDFFDGGELTPLHLAVMAGKDQMVKLILEHGANVDALDKDGSTPLYIASKSSRVAIVGHIIRHCPDLLNESNGRSVRAAVTSSKVDRYQSDRTRFRDYSSILDMLIQYGFTVAQEDKNDAMLLYTAVERGHLRFVEEMLKSNPDRSILNVSQQASVTPLHIAARKGHESIVALLLSSGADVNAVDRAGNTPLFYTTDFSSAERLLNENAKAANCTNIWFAAIERCRIKLVEMLLQKGSNANARNEDGMTALHVACSRNSVQVVKVLLKWGADVELKCAKRGYTALHIAAGREDDQDIIVSLLEYGADIDSLSEPVAQSALPASRGVKSGGAQQLARQSGTQRTEAIAKTPLYVAVESGLVDNVCILLDYGADINIRCGDCTPLMYAGRKHAEKEEEAHSPEYLHKEATKWAKVRAFRRSSEHSWDPDRYRNYEAYEDDVISENESAFKNAYEQFLDMHDSGRWSGELVTQFSKIAVELRRHMVLLKNINIFVHERDLQTRDLETIDLCTETESECKYELTKLQKTKVGTSNVSFYDFLSMKQSDCANLYKKENVGESLNCRSFRNVRSLIHYGRMINYRMVIAREWPAVSSKAIPVLEDLFPMLPYPCLQKITDFMGYSDLKRLAHRPTHM